MSRSTVFKTLYEHAGCDTKHPDLVNNVWRNPAEIAGNGIDDDANGFVDDVVGWNFASHSPDIHDVDGHGTHVAAIVAGSGTRTTPRLRADTTALHTTLQLVHAC